MNSTEFRDLAVWRQILLVVVTVLAAGAAGTGLAFTVATGDMHPAAGAVIAVTLLAIVGVNIAEPTRDLPEDEDEVWL